MKITILSALLLALSGGAYFTLHASPVAGTFAADAHSAFGQAVPVAYYGSGGHKGGNGKHRSSGV